MSDFAVRGADDFLKLSKALKKAGRGDLRKELNKSMKTAAKPLIGTARDAFRAGLPSGGGLNAFMAKKRITVVTRTGKDPGVSVKVANADPRLDSQGRLTHPVFGRRPNVVQRVQPAIFSGAMQAEAPEIRGDLEQALENFAERIVREAR